MSTSPYSQDLREKVIHYLLQGNTQRQAILNNLALGDYI
jgi:hypothetical protein